MTGLAQTHAGSFALQPSLLASKHTGRTHVTGVEGLGAWVLRGQWIQEEEKDETLCSIVNRSGGAVHLRL